MQTKTLFACACGALSLALLAAPAPKTAEVPGKPYSVNEAGHALVTKDVMRTFISKEAELRRKLAEPRYYKDVQGDVQDLLRQLKADPFEGRAGRVDESQPKADQDEAWHLYQVYSAYLKTSRMRRQLQRLVGAYEAHGMFRHAARVERAKDFYKSDRMKGLLRDLRMFDATFNQMDRTIYKRYEEGARFGFTRQRQVTLTHLFHAESLFGDYVDADGTPKSGFWNGLTVLMRYNERMCGDELKKMKEAAAEVSGLLGEFTDSRRAAVEATTRHHAEHMSAIAEIVSLDERIADCITLALLEFDRAVKTFEDTGSDEFQLRSGLPCVHVFAATGVDTDRRQGPNYRRLVTLAYHHLLDKFDALSQKRNDQRMPIR